MSPMNVFIKFFLETENPELVQELPIKMVNAVDLIALPDAYYDFNKSIYVVTKDKEDLSEHQFREYIDRYAEATETEITSYLREDINEEIKKYFSSREVIQVIEKRLFDHFLKTGKVIYDE